MNRPRRPSYSPPRRRPSGPPTSGGGPGFGGPPRRRNALDLVPQDPDNPYKVLGQGMDRQAIQAGAQPMEMVVIQGFTREIEEPFQKWKGRPDDFWNEHPQLLGTVRKLDDLLGSIAARRK